MSVTGPLPGVRPETGGADFIDVLRRRWALILVALVLGMVGGWWASTQRAPTYTSTTQVLVLPTAADAEEVNLDTEAQLVTSTRTAERVASQTDLGLSPDELAARVEITVPPNSEVLEITFSASTPERAQQGAAAFAEAYLRQRGEAADAEAAQWIDALTDRISELRDDAASGPVIEALERELALRQATPVRPGEVISPATLPTSPSSPNRLLFVLSGAVAGLLAGLGAALVAQRVDPRVMGPADLPDGLSSQVVLDLRGRPLAPVVAAPPTSLFRQFARLRTTLAARAAHAEDATAVWLVTAARGGPAPGVVTANLAATLARAGHKVAAVAARPDSSLLTALGVAPDATAGLAGALTGAPVASLLTPAPIVPGVSVLPPGDLAPVMELPVPEAKRVLTALGDHADQVLLETRSLNRSADAASLCTTAAAVLLVVEKRVTRRAEVQAAIEDLTRIGAPAAGIALVPGRRRRLLWRRGGPGQGSAAPVRARATVPPGGGGGPSPAGPGPSSSARPTSGPGVGAKAVANDNTMIIPAATDDSTMIIPAVGTGADGGAGIVSDRQD